MRAFRRGQSTDQTARSFLFSHAKACSDAAVRIEAIAVTPYALPLKEPFTISRASVASTRAVLVTAVLSSSEGGRRARGYGEAALPLGAPETTDDLRAAIEHAAERLIGAEFEELAFTGPLPARSGLHCALVDARARLRNEPLWAALEGAAPRPLITDITLPIAEPAHLAALAAGYFAEGFRCFKIKVGADLERDCSMVRALAPFSATLRFDANEGFSAAQALELLACAHDEGLVVECFEQPCKRADLAGLKAVREQGGVPIVADESIRDERDLEKLVEAGAVDGVNLKLVKMGGIDRCMEIGRLAQRHGLRLMVGAMIESRLGLTAMAHVAAALGGAEWVDLDTAFLLERDPCIGGMQADGATLTLPDAPGLGIEMTPMESL